MIKIIEKDAAHIVVFENATPKELDLLNSCKRLEKEELDAKIVYHQATLDELSKQAGKAEESKQESIDAKLDAAAAEAVTEAKKEAEYPIIEGTVILSGNDRELEESPKAETINITPKKKSNTTTSEKGDTDGKDSRKEISQKKLIWIGKQEKQLSEEDRQLKKQIEEAYGENPFMGEDEKKEFLRNEYHYDLEKHDFEEER